eukprot:EG_transcript_61804
MVHTLSLPELTWKVLQTSGPFPPPPAQHSACVHGNEMLVYGGCDADGDHLGFVSALDCDSLEWRPVHCSGDSPGGLSSHVACVVENVGGDAADGPELLVHGGTD